MGVDCVTHYLCTSAAFYSLLFSSRPFHVFVCITGNLSLTIDIFFVFLHASYLGRVLCPFTVQVLTWFISTKKIVTKTGPLQKLTEAGEVNKIRLCSKSRARFKINGLCLHTGLRVASWSARFVPFEVEVGTSSETSKCLVLYRTVWDHHLEAFSLQVRTHVTHSKH